MNIIKQELVLLVIVRCSVPLVNLDLEHDLPVLKDAGAQCLG